MIEINPREIELIEAVVPSQIGAIQFVCYPASIVDVVECIAEIRYQMHQAGISEVDMYTTAKEGARILSKLYN